MSVIVLVIDKSTILIITRMIIDQIGLHLVLLPLLILNGRKFRAVEVVAFPFPLISTCLGKKKKTKTKKTERVKTWIRLA